MPHRDRRGTEGTEAGRIVSRRAVLAGMGAALCFPPAFAATPIRVGVPRSLGLAAEPLSAVCGSAVIPVAYDSWAVLLDHAACGGAGLIDAAVLAVEGAGPGLPVRPPSLWVSAAHALVRVGVPLAHPSSDAVLRCLLGDGLRIVPLPAGMLWPNLCAGLLDAAVVVGDDAGRATPQGLRRWSQATGGIAALLPRLGIVSVGSLA